MYCLDSCRWAAASVSLHGSPLSSLSHCLSLPRRTLQKGNKSSSKPSREDTADVATLLQLTRSALEQLQSEVWCSCGWWCLQHYRDCNCSIVSMLKYRTCRFGSTCLNIMVVMCYLFTVFLPFYPLFSVWVPEQWGAESWRLLSKLTACGRVWPPAVDGYFQPCFRNRPEGLLQQRSPQLQHRDWRLPQSTPTTAGLHHGTHTSVENGCRPADKRMQKSLNRNLTCSNKSCWHYFFLRVSRFSGAGNAKGSIRSFCVREWGSKPATNAAFLPEPRREAHIP